MSQHFLKLSVLDLIGEARVAAKPERQLFLHGAGQHECSGELICIIPEELRYLYDLSMRICMYGMELEVSLTELEPNSDEYIICLEDIFLIEQKSAIVSDILFVELLQKYAEMDVGENYSIRYITEWRVIRVPDTPPEEDTDADEIPQYYN